MYKKALYVINDLATTQEKKSVFYSTLGQTVTAKGIIDPILGLQVPVERVKFRAGKCMSESSRLALRGNTEQRGTVE